MQNQPDPWAAAFTELFRALQLLIPGLLALGGTWIALRAQRKHKALELQHQSALRARELLFEVKRSNLNREREQTSKTLADLGKLLGTMKARGDESAEEMRALLSLLKEGLLLWYSTSPLEAALAHVQGGSLSNDAKVALELVRSTLQINLDEHSSFETYLRYATAYAIMSQLRGVILEADCEALLTEYLSTEKSPKLLSPRL